MPRAAASRDLLEDGLAHEGPSSPQPSRQNIWVSALILAGAVAAVYYDTPNVVYQASSDLLVGPTPLTGFLIAHSHTDPGWVRTFAEYQAVEVQRILSNSLSALAANPKRHFSWSEVCYFAPWWEAQRPDRRDLLRRLVAEGRWEFVGGGWVMNDEACPTPSAVIANLALGHSYLQRHFGVKPRVGWQIDPFGHSAATPSLFADMGFEALVINRISDTDKASRRASKSLEFLWKASPVNRPNDPGLMTHILRDHYAGPPGLNFEKAHIFLTDANIQGYADRLAAVVRAHGASYRSSNVMVPVGDDFVFQENRIWDGIEALMDYIHAHPARYRLTLKWATPSQYFDALAAEDQLAFPSYSGDFFPYANQQDDEAQPQYWTGYYTSRPAFKTAIRAAEATLRAAEAVYALARMEDHPTRPSGWWRTLFGSLEEGRRTTALLQHHDAITGTSKENVLDDYQARLHAAMSQTWPVLTSSVGWLLTHLHPDSDGQGGLSEPPVPVLSPNTTDLYTWLAEATSSAAIFPLTVVNSLGWARSEVIELIVPRTDLQVVARSPDGSLSVVPSQFGLIWDKDGSDFHSEAFRLVFPASMPGLGFSSYYLRITPNPATVWHSVQLYVSKFVPTMDGVPGSATLPLDSLSGPIWLTNSYLRAGISPLNGLPLFVTQVRESRKLPLGAELWSAPNLGGAYISKPAGSPFETLASSKLLFLTVSSGPVMQEVLAVYPELAVRTTLWIDPAGTGSGSRTADADPAIESFLGFSLLNLAPMPNIETVLRFRTSLASGREFWTDNGLEMRRRTRGLTSWSSLPDTYPAVSAAGLRGVVDDGTPTEFTVLLETPCGVTSSRSGNLDLIVHRAFSQDDNRGVNQALDDASPAVDLSFRLLFSSHHDAAAIDPELFRGHASAGLLFPPVVLAAKTRPKSPTGTIDGWAQTYVTTYSGFGAELPYAAGLAALRALDGVSDGLYISFQSLHSLESHAGPRGESPDVVPPSAMLEIDLKELFSGYHWDGLVETNLDGILGGRPRPRLASGPPAVHQPWDIPLLPSEIVTFSLELAKEVPHPAANYLGTGGHPTTGPRPASNSSYPAAGDANYEDSHWGWDEDPWIFGIPYSLVVVGFLAVLSLWSKRKSVREEAPRSTDKLL